MREARERFYRTVWGRAGVKKKAKKEKEPELLVFFVHRETECGQCGAKIGSGGMVYLEGEQAKSLKCVGMGELEFLPAGDASLTRRVTKAGARKIVVLEFSRSRGRYERQGLLVEKAVLERARG